MTQEENAKEIDVAVAAIVHDRRVLLVQRHPKAQFGLKWGTPGGGREEGETIEEALSREIDEEIGLTIATLDRDVSEFSHLCTKVYKPPTVIAPIRLSTFLVRIPFAPQILLNRSECIGFGWFDASLFAAASVIGALTPGTVDAMPAIIKELTR